MDTPDKKTQSNPNSLLSTFEDSPVFNYISSLSPIKPFNLGHNRQSFPLLTFPSPQSSQTTPNSCPKESNITSVIRISDVPKNNSSQSGNEEEIAITSGAVQPAHLDKIDSGRGITVSAADESSKLVVELPKSLKYECASAESGAVHCNAVTPDRKFDGAITEITPLKVIKKECLSFENEKGVQGIHLEQNKEACEWEKFIYEASDILSYHSPTEEMHHEELDDKCVDSVTRSFIATVLQAPNENVDDTQKMESANFMSSENHDMKLPLIKTGAGKPSETSLVPDIKAHAVLADKVAHYSNTEIDEKSSSEQQQTRRCLIYEMSGSHYRKLLSDSADSSPSSKMPASPNTSNEKCLIARRPGCNKFSSLLPGIGLHLNALAATARDKIIVKRQTLTCRRQLISSPSTISSFNSVTSDTKPLNTRITPDLSVNDNNEQKDVVQLTGSACLSSTSGEGIQLRQSSPKKKRRKSETVGETDSCKRCNCKRSKCLKLYCECFAAGLYCVEPCNCQDCFNKPIHEETVLETRQQIESRNPLAFAPKVIKCLSTPQAGDDLNKTPASARHKRGCNCKKSGCLKKYCECFQGGVGCSLSCRCEGCKNTFGRKEGTEAIAIYEEAQIVEKNETNLTSCNEISRTNEEDQEQASPKSSKNARQPVRRPFHFGGIVPQFLSVLSGPSLQPCETQKINKSDESELEEDVKISPEDEAPEVLKGDYSLSTYVKSASPNCKRVSPPHCDSETSPGWRSCRKLILRSIPSLPTLTRGEKSMEFPGKLE